MQFKKEEKFLANINQRDVCRVILDRNEVLGTRITELVMEKAGNDIDPAALRDLVQLIRAETTKSSNATVDAVVNLFSK